MRTALLSLVALALSAPALAVPMHFNHQGRLNDALGVPLDTPQNVTFRIYDDPAGGTMLWEEAHTALGFTSGYFTVQLGSVTTLQSDDFDGTTRYLAIQVGTGAELPTRLALVSVPYAVRSSSADLATQIVPGAVIDASELRINGTTVIDNTGALSAAHTHDAAEVDTGIFDVTRMPDHTHVAADITNVLDVTQLPVGTGASNVAAGDHSHTPQQIGALPDTTTAADIGALPDTTTAADIGALPDTTTAADIGALPDTTTAADIGALPDTTTAADIGALPDTTTAADIGALAASGGNVTGDLTLDGSVQIGASTAACGSGNLGTMKWEDGLFVCTDIGWDRISTGTIGTPSNPASTCLEIKNDQPSAADGPYSLDIPNHGVESIYCDMTTDGGGWTLVRTSNGTTSPNLKLETKVNMNQLDQDVPSTNAQMDSTVVDNMGSILMAVNTDAAWDSRIFWDKNRAANAVLRRVRWMYVPSQPQETAAPQSSSVSMPSANQWGQNVGGGGTHINMGAGHPLCFGSWTNGGTSKGHICINRNNTDWWNYGFSGAPGQGNSAAKTAIYIR